MHWANLRLTVIWLREGSRGRFYFVPWSSPPSQHSSDMYVHSQYCGAKSRQRWACRSRPFPPRRAQAGNQESLCMTGAAVTWTHLEKLCQFLLCIVADSGCAWSFRLLSHHALTGFVLILCAVLEPAGMVTCKILRKSVSQSLNPRIMTNAVINLQLNKLYLKKR